ncbi:MAG: DMT family transporter [Streptosporangiales bacterium]|nr:DMT family transporter [Streptosporangiales bacterium]
MGVLLSLLAAVGYGASDFIAGAAGRRGHPGAVAAVGQAGVIAAVGLALVIVPGSAPSAAALWWGALSGLGTGVGVLALYWGLSVSRMSIVSPISGVLTAGIPAVTGAVIGQHLSPLGWAGVAAGIPAVALVSAEPGDADGGTSRRDGVIAGLAAGAGFALLFIALDRAGTASGAWPLVPGELIGTVLVLAWLIPARNRPRRGQWRPSVRFGLVAGVLGGAASILYLVATGAGQLAVVAVVTALYPGVTVLMARFVFHERWGPAQVTGLMVSAFAIAAVSAG